MLAATMLAGCSSDEDEWPVELLGNWQLIQREYGTSGKIDIQDGGIVNFAADKKMYSVEDGYLIRWSTDGSCVKYHYSFFEGGQKLGLFFATSEGIEFVMAPPNEFYQKVIVPK